MPRDDRVTVNPRFLLALPLISGVLAALLPASEIEAAEQKRPNILFAIADDWGWPHAGAYGDPAIKTPTFDRLAKEGVMFHHAYVSSPSCTPSRAAIVTGQWHWRLEESANLWSTLKTRFPVYPDMLEESGYHVGYTRKGWGPGKVEVGGRRRNPAGEKFRNMAEFLAKRPKDKPFCFWFGSYDPHRGYKLGSGKASGIPLDKIKLFACFPDSLKVRSDVADYYFEVQRFDREVGGLLKQIDALGELDNTIVVMTGDHGMPFPRCKSNLYDSGARVCMAVRWPSGIKKSGREISDFVSTTDLAPTFLELAGVKPPKEMTGRSILPLLTSEKSGQISADRMYVLTGKERHVPGQEGKNGGGYPQRAIRTHDFLYIHNIDPDRWPAGTPYAEKAWRPGYWLADCDNGPTKTYMVDNRGKDDLHRRLYDLSFGKRPRVELYDVKKDPEQLTNVAGKPQYADVQKKLAAQLMAELKATGDPRVVGGGELFDDYPYYGGGPTKPGFRRKRPKRK
jgi:N-sulfoglucosamine sulfohydrolase